MKQCRPPVKRKFYFDLEPSNKILPCFDYPFFKSTWFNLNANVTSAKIKYNIKNITKTKTSLPNCDINSRQH